MAAAAGDSTRGVLVVMDSIASNGNYIVFASTLELRFEPLLGRSMPCYRPGEERETAVMRTLDGYLIRFTPRAGDCGFLANVMVRDDTTMTGRWAQDARQGRPAIGRITMRRVGTGG